MGLGDHMAASDLIDALSKVSELGEFFGGNALYKKHLLEGKPKNWWTGDDFTIKADDMHMRDEGEAPVTWAKEATIDLSALKGHALATGSRCNTLLWIRQNHPKLQGERLKRSARILARSVDAREDLIEVLNLANYNRSIFGYERHTAYQRHLENEAASWCVEREAKLIAQLEAAARTRALAASDPLDELPDGLVQELEIEFGPDNARRGVW